MSIAVGIVAGVLSTLVAYSSLDGPLPATTTRVAQVEKYAETTREILLLDKLFIRQEELYRAEKALRDDPTNEELERRVFDLKRQITLLERQLEDLEGHDHADT